MTAGAVYGQALEENPAPLILGAPKLSLTQDELVDLGNDPTPFGVTLRKLVVVDERHHGRSVKPRGKAAAIDVSMADALARQEAFQSILSQYLGQPLSFRMISEIQATVVQYYRDRGRPLMALSVPPQEISDGGLQINVITFVLGKKHAEGNRQVPEAFLTDQLRLRSGEEIDADRLIDDVNWLNLNPYRKVRVFFEPGLTYGTTDLALQVEEKRPWSGYVGASNSGIGSTGINRLFAGFNTANLPFQDHQLAYQFTIAPQSLGSGDLFRVRKEKGYVSHAFTYFAPLTFADGTRSKLTLQAYYVGSFSDPNGITTTASTATVASAELAFPLVRRSGKFAVLPEAYFKLEAKRKNEDQFFLGIPISSGSTDIGQISLGLRADVFGTLFGAKSEGKFNAYVVAGKNRVSSRPDENHVYLALDGEQVQELKLGMSVAAKVKAQWSGSELPSIEQIGIGGAGTVRGYETNELSSHSGIAASLELRGKRMKVGGANSVFGAVPFGFLDVGHAASTLTEPATAIGSVGLGGRFEFGSGTTGVLEVAHSLAAGPVTGKGDTRIHFNLVSRF